MEMSLGGVAAVVEPAQFCEAIVVGFAREIVECIAKEMNVAALPCGLWEDFSDGALEAWMIIGNGEANAGEATLLETEEKGAPARGGLTIGEFDADDASASLPIDADGDEDGARADDAILADLLIAGIDDEVRILGLEALASEALEFLIEARVEVADGAGAKLVAAELLAHGLDLSSRDALDIHLDESSHESLLTALITLENLGAETALAVLRNAKLHGADTSDEFARIIATAIAEAAIGALALGGAEGIIHLGLQELLNGELDDAADEVLILSKYGFEFAHGALTMFLGHGWFFLRVAWSLPIPSMTRFLFAELSGHYQ
jgi:hypothetical protein